MRKRAWIAIAFLGMVMSAIIGIASADEFSRDKYSGREQVISIDVVRDGSVAYASLWTSYAVDRWDVLMKVASVDPYTGEVRTSVTTAAGVMSNGTTLVRRAFGKEFLYNVNFDDNEYIDVQHGFVTDTASHTAKNELSWKWSLPEAIPTPTAAPTAMPTPTSVVTALWSLRMGAIFTYALNFRTTALLACTLTRTASSRFSDSFCFPPESRSEACTFFSFILRKSKA